MKVKKTAIVYHKSDLDGVVSAAIATMYENSKDRDIVYDYLTKKNHHTLEGG